MIHVYRVSTTLSNISYRYSKEVMSIPAVEDTEEKGRAGQVLAVIPGAEDMGSFLSAHLAFSERPKVCTEDKPGLRRRPSVLLSLKLG